MFNTVKAPPDGWYLIHVDGCVVDNPKDWITVPDEAMPAVRFIIEEVERDERLHRPAGGKTGDSRRRAAQ